ncbi:MarR family winged helix-turn-helix transcriptional regulator [Streptomyces sp. NPDC002888]|uniref:MarR family winged helix-turn-helix transcriptional regulator n=1 Tax=Streptomyces sp. NPDC002888 TaxID=3364668 RepID=UPI00369DF80C
MTLMHLGSGPVSQQALIDKLEVDPSVLVAILKDLEGADLVQRRRDPADRRRHIVQITAQGTITLGALDTALSEVEDRLFAALSAHDRVSLRGLLERIATSEADHEC